MSEGESVATGDAPARPAVRVRTFAEVHADVWRLIRAHPLVFVVMPAAVTVLFDAILEAAFRASSDPWGPGLPRIGWFLGSFTVQIPFALVLTGVREIAEGRSADPGEVLRKTWPAYGRLLLAVVLASARLFIGLILFIVPAIYLMVRYALISPAAVLDDAISSDAIRASAAAMHGRYWRTVGMVVAATLTYLPWLLIPVTPEDAPRILTVFESLPIGLVATWGTMGAGLIYLDRTGRGAPRPAGSGVEPVRGARGFIFLAGGLGWGGLILFLLLQIMLSV